MKRILILLVLIGLFAVQASADTFTFNEDAALMLWEVYENPINGTTLTTVTNDPIAYGGGDMSGVVGFVGTVHDTITGNPYSPFAQIQIGANFWGASGAVGTSGATTAQVIGTALGVAPTNSLVGYDTYSLYLQNDNDDDWMVNIFLNTGYTDAPFNEPDNYYENGWTLLHGGEGIVLSIDLTGVANLDHVTNIGFNVGSNMGVTGANWPSNPDIFHVSIVPVPAAFILGLLGLGAAGIKMRKYA